MSDSRSRVLLPDGSEASPSEEQTSERAIERTAEDQQFVPVIIKRTDQARRHPDDILEQAIAEGQEQLERRVFSLLLSSIAAGLILGFSAMAVAVVTTALQGIENPMLVRLATALVYPLGFIVCIMSGSELFTEHTATAVYPVLDRRVPQLVLFRLWLVVIVGNLLGAACSAFLLALADDVVNAKVGYIEIAEHLVSFPVTPLFVSAVLAGWLMAQGSWLILATPPTISQIACLFTVTFLIGIGGLHHSIAGAVEMFTGLAVSDRFTYGAAASFLGVAIVGNLVGGSLFVALLNYAHIRKTQEVHDGTAGEEKPKEG